MSMSLHNAVEYFKKINKYYCLCAHLSHDKKVNIFRFNFLSLKKIKKETQNMKGIKFIGWVEKNNGIKPLK